MQDRTFEIMEKRLESGLYDIFAAGEDAPDRAVMEELGRELGVTFPEDFLAHATGRYGGVYVAAREDYWPRPQQHAVGPFWTFLYGLYVYGVAKDVPDFMDMRAKAAAFREETGHVVAPCLKIMSDPDFYCFDASGALMCWRHETDTLEPQNKSFFEILDDELRALSERATQMREQRAKRK
jgi:hypothetical protein